MLVVSDCSPLHYLILIQRDWLLPKLYDRVVAPAAVVAELSHPHAPDPVRQWATHVPHWLEVQAPKAIAPGLESLDAGEAAAISLAHELAADVVLIDEMLGRKSARSHGFLVTGTLGVLENAARRGLTSLADDLALLAKTNYHCTPALLERLLRLHDPK